ncbi:MAG: 50S ribosomal protein L4 [Candidatus Woesearchaeota archaeon]|nr:MAG: 50S ribosomal protein L4 [Candidatus Woesearchaeota archaeon]
MKATILNLEGKEIGKLDLPKQFSEEIRPDLIKRAVIAIQANKRQPYGNAPTAGKRAAAKLSRRRRDYKTAYGIGISRAPRKIMSRSGTRFNWVGAFAPGTVGGRQAHPPKSSKIWKQKINIKERRKAIRSALSATISKDHVHFDKIPLIVDSNFENLNKTKQVIEILKKLGLEIQLERTKQIKIRAGKGKMRGRRYKVKKGPLIVVSKNCNLSKAARNIPGIDVSTIKNLNAELLAPGTIPGRITIYTKDSIELMEKENLFI